MRTILCFLGLSLVSLVACGGGGGGTPPANSPTSAAAQQAAMDKKDEPPLPTKPDSDKVTWKQSPAYAKCHNDVQTGKDVAAGVTSMAQGCASSMGLHQIGTTLQENFANGDKAHTIPLKAEAGKCYRVYGLSEDSLQDLDIAIMDSNGKAVAEDGSDSPDAVVLEDGMVCYTAADASAINIAAGNGAGKFAVQVWGN